MISSKETVAFVWRCSGCPAVYDGETLAMLLDDGTSRACPCGGRLTEDVVPVPERPPRPLVSARLRGTDTHRD